MMGSEAKRLRIFLKALAGLLLAYGLGVGAWQAVMVGRAQSYTQLAGADVTLLPALALGSACAGIVHAALVAAAAFQKKYGVCVTLAVLGGLVLLLAILLVAAAALAEQLANFTDVGPALEAARADYLLAPAEWDSLQRERGCCGVLEASDWSTVVSSSRGLPMSCCAAVDGQVGMSICLLTSNNRHKYACAPGLRDELHAQFELSCFVLIGQLVLQVISVVGVSVLTHKLRSEW